MRIYRVCVVNWHGCVRIPIYLVLNLNGIIYIYIDLVVNQQRFICLGLAEPKRRVKKGGPGAAEGKFRVSGPSESR